MQKRKFDELISYFNRKVADMDIDTNYKMELLGMVTALGYAHEKETEERKKGKWIRWYETKEDETGTIYIPHCKCSECNTEHNPVRSKSVSFCDICGADMRGETEDNE